MTGSEDRLAGPETTRARLRRLRREGGGQSNERPDSAAVSAKPSAGSQLPAWLRRRLGASSRAGESVPAEVGDVGGADWSQGQPRELELVESPEGPYLARTTWHAREDSHGSWRLAELAGVDPEAFALLCADRSLADLDLERAVFLDTETTGLSGGAGTYVFMVGLGTFVEGRFQVWQGFLGGPEQERALLAETSRRVCAAGSVVSFFGKSFDRHRLEDKMRIVGVEPPFEDRPHLDLYHPLRRLTAGQFEDGKLQTLEAGLLELVREQDLPGSMAPAAWFDYLAGRPHRLEGVFHHNSLDVLSLVTLAAHLGHTLVENRPGSPGRPLLGCDVRRARAVGRALWHGGDRREALVWMQRAIHRAQEQGLSSRADRWKRAEMLRLLGEKEPARAALEEVAAGEPDEVGFLVRVALAKLCEHGFKDSAAALAWAAEALEVLEGMPGGGEARHSDVVKRIERLEGRVSGK